jgi:carboxyl-terminal processing protease
MAERLNLMLTPEGRLAPLQERYLTSKVSEKKDLSRWAGRFESAGRDQSFLGAWRELEARLTQSPQKAAIIAVGINAYLSVVKDPHTYIMPLAMYEEVVANSETQSSNSGLLVRRLEGRWIVRKVYEGSEAERIGLKKGDELVALNGMPIAEMIPHQVTEFIRMRGVSRLSLEVMRAGESKYFELRKERGNYPSVISKLIGSPEKIGLLVIHKFARGSCDLARQQVTILKEENIKGLLLDLRDNPGGQVDEAACIVNLFSEKGRFLFETRYLNLSKPSERYFAETQPIYRGPLAVLINGGSASAAEIVAGALREQERAKLVGERSFGKGSFQDGRIWALNSKIAFFQTEGLYYFPSGWTPQLVGLQPDIEVQFGPGLDSREEDLYLNPLIPVDSWKGPQTLSWLNEKDCPSSADFLLFGEDPQINKAQSVLSCGGQGDRNSAL